MGYSASETFHPVFLYESLWCLLVALLLMRFVRFQRLQPGSVFALYVAFYSFGRGFIELIRIDDSHVILGLRLNVFTSLALFFLAIIFLVRRNSVSKPS